MCTGKDQAIGFTQYLMHEVRRYGRNHEVALTLCLAAPEHHKLSYSELDDIDRTLGPRGRIVCLDQEGRVIEGILSTKPPRSRPLVEVDAVQAYSSLRRYMAAITDARVLIGGMLSGFCRGNAWNCRRGNRCCRGSATAIRVSRLWGRGCVGRAAASARRSELGTRRLRTPRRRAHRPCSRDA